MDAIRLLLIEDSEDDAILVANRLRHSGLDLTVQRVQTAQAMSEALSSQPPDVIISDNRMPRFSAEIALSLLRDSGLDVPFIVVSGQIGEEAAASLMRSGAHDFVLKDSLTRLGPAVQRELREARERHERRRAQAALYSTEQRFRLVAEHLRDIVFRLRLGDRPVLEYISPAVVEVTGHAAEEWYADAEQIFLAVEPDDREEVRRAWTDPPAKPLVTRWRRVDGSIAWIEQRLVAVRHHGTPPAVEGILRDVTDQVLADRQRESLERQLHQAERLDSLGQLAGGVAHDFNNLLSIISGYTELALAELGPDHPCRADLECIEHAASQAAALTRQLLIFSRHQPSHPEVVDLNAVVADLERLLRRTIGEDVDFTIEAEPGLRPVTIDRSRLEQVLMNLVVNARAAMPDGGRLTISTSHGNRSGNGDPGADPRVRLTVTDTGCGMDAATQQRVFEPFFTTKGPGKGSGLGLATVYGVVTDAGGRITLSSEPGRGTQITVELPAADRPAATDAVAVPTEPVPPRGSGHVLLIEDDDMVREVTRRILDNGGYDVTDVSTREDALRLLGGPESFQVVLSDVVMPGMSAAEFVAIVRAAHPTLPIIFMSGYTGHRPGTADPLPADIPTLTKPVDGAHLLRRIREATNSRSDPV
jgi:PAS domain S-box-containing protein